MGRVEAIAVTAVGLCSSLGGAVSAAAAARAGLSRARELPEHVVMGHQGEEQPLVGHAVEAAAGFRGAAKWIALAWPALEELLAAQGGAISPDRTALLLALPEGAADARTMCQRLAALAKLELAPERMLALPLGRAGFSAAVVRACLRLLSGEWRRCLVGGVDSLLDASVVAALRDAERLKTTGQPDGLQPGEAAGFVLLERRSEAERRGARVLGVIEAASGDDPDPPEAAQGITHVAEGLIGGGWLVSDHNGETTRATELGNFLARLAARDPELARSACWFPALSFGDTGAASGALAAVLALRAFERGYAPAERALVLSCSDGAARGAMAIGSD